jgi:hypothetical protein
MPLRQAIFAVSLADFNSGMVEGTRAEKIPHVCLWESITDELPEISGNTESVRSVSEHDWLTERLQEKSGADSDGRLTLAGLQEMIEKTLAGNYDASRDTVRKARNQVVSEYSAGPIPDK